MFHVKDHKTPYMFDPFEHLGPKRRKLLDDSWAGVFRKHVRPILPVHLFVEHFDSQKGRPTNELVAMMGAMILQQMHDLSDEETMSQFAFNLQWHYALDITSESDKDAYVCSRSFWAIRNIMTTHDLYRPVFDTVGDNLANVFDVDPSLQRIDSVHIFSNMRHLGRIGVFVETIKKFLTNLKRHHTKAFSTLEKDLADRYIKKERHSVFSMVKPSESSRTLEILGNDLFSLLECFKADEKITAMNSYQLMVRMLKEQCIVKNDKTTNAKKVTVKSNKEVPSDSLQNPSDPDAGYDGHKGKGYQVQVAETYSTEECKEQLSLITHVEVESADKSDAKALSPYLSSVKERDLSPKQVLADSLYGSDANCEEAKEMDIELVAPTMGGTKQDQCSLADFTFSEENRVIACPQGHTPSRTKRKKGRLSAAFALETCERCSLQNHCPAKAGKKAYYLRYTDKTARLSRRRTLEKTDEFREKYRYRAGVEATMSQYDRRTGVKRLRVRGLRAVSFCAFLKATALNILRAAAHNRNLNRGKYPTGSIFGHFPGLFQIIKEQFPIMSGIFTGILPISFLKYYRVLNARRCTP